MIVLDDTGFGHLGCYGSPIETPALDEIAAQGLRYNNMHTTALCSPSRSCIVTGRNHHANGMACITELATGYPGYNGVMPFENGMLSEILVEQGYSTFMVGKWHLTPSNQETAAGPYHRWPLGRGFERFYGFLGGDTAQWYPDLVYDNHQVEPPKKPEEGYRLSEDTCPPTPPQRDVEHGWRRNGGSTVNWLVGGRLAPYRRHPCSTSRWEGVGGQVSSLRW